MLSAYKLSWQLTNAIVMLVTRLAFQNVWKILKTVSMPAMVIPLVIKTVLEVGLVSFKIPLVRLLQPPPMHKKLPLLLLLLLLLPVPALSHLALNPTQ